jgi:type IV pilus modification protein PilV
METFLSHRHKSGSSRGFTMVEVLVAILVLTVGLVSLSALATQTVTGTQNSRFAGLSANLASEKLEDLNRWPVTDPNVWVAAGSTAGSLSLDVQTSVTSPLDTETINYYDNVYISNTNVSSTDETGAVSETVFGMVNGTETYTTLTHNPNGTIGSSSSTTAPSAIPNSISFHRRWVIERDQPVSGVERVTVLVTLTNQYVQPPVSYQMSMIRAASK